MRAAHVHEFMSLDAVIDAPAWTAGCGSDPKMACEVYQNEVVYLAYRPQA